MSILAVPASSDLQSRDLGIIGNCQVAALVDASARINWMCYPRLDSDPIFCSLIGGDRLSLGEFWRNGTFSFDLEDGVPECAFTICTLWFIEALARIGRETEALEMFEDVLRSRNALGLLPEGYLADTGELWGDFPQTYAMVGLIRRASRLSASWEQAF